MIYFLWLLWMSNHSPLHLLFECFYFIQILNCTYWSIFHLFACVFVSCSWLWIPWERNFFFFFVMGCIFWPLKIHVKVLKPWYLRMWPYLEVGSLQMYLVKRRLYCSRVGPYFIRIGVFIERRNCPFATHTHRTPGEDKSRKQKTSGWCWKRQGMPRIANHQT